MKYHPKNEGKDHINAYSKSLTSLGKKLTNFYHAPFEHPKYGKFNSVEGLWYYLKTGRVFNQFKSLSGYAAKKEGQKIQKSIGFSDRSDETYISEDFKNDIKEGIRAKFRDNVNLLNELIDCDLPIAHYYYFGDPEKDNVKIKDLSQYKWVIDEIEKIREISKNHLKKNNKKKFIKKKKNKP
tara:strand:- start:20914 stop:21459 length:546 start_codon:yes stop_codon:yes gene_type:complete